MAIQFPGPLHLTGIELRTSEYLANDSMMLMSGREVIGIVKVKDGGWVVIPFIEDSTVEGVQARTTCIVIPPPLMEVVRQTLKQSKGVELTDDSPESQ